MLKIKTLIILLTLLYFKSFPQGIIYLKPRQIYPKDLNLINITWNKNDGLPTKNIFDIQKTKEGFIWLATDEGLIRFDGIKFKVFNRENVPLFKRKFITHLFVHGNTLWFNNGITGLYQLKDKKFKRLLNKNGEDFKNVSAIVYKFNKLFIGTRSTGLHIFDEDKHLTIDTAFGLGNNKVNNVYVFSKDSLIISTNGSGIYFLNKNKLIKPEFNKNLPGKFIKILLKDKKGNLWLSSKKRLLLIKNNSPDFVYKFSAFNNVNVTALIEDFNSNIWIGTANKGLYLYRNDSIYQFSKEHGLKENNITSIYSPNKNEIWITTRKGDLHLLHSTNLSVITKSDGLPSDFIYSVYQTKDKKILSGTDKGIAEINEDGTVKRTILKDKSVLFMADDYKRNLITSERDNGVFIYNKNKTIHLTAAKTLGVNYIRSIITGKDKIYFGTNGNGLLIYEKDKTKKISTPQGLSSRFVSCLYKSKSGKILVGTAGSGLNIVDGSEVVKIYNEDNGLSENLITSIYEDEEGYIWVTTNGGGLNRIKDDKIEVINKKNGLYSNELYSIAEDKNKRFWFSTKEGIFNVYKNDLNDFIKGKLVKVNSVIYRKNDGMLSEECTGGTSQGILVSDKDKIYIATYDGLVIIDPKKKRKKEQNIFVYIDEISLNDSTVDYSKTITLKPDQDKLEISFSAIQFLNPNRILFNFIMEGLNDKWKKKKSVGTISYLDLAPGEYSFKVKAKYGNSDWGNNIASVKIIKEPYFWQTVIFRIFISLLLLIVIIFSVRYVSTIKLKRKLAKMEAEHALEHERMRISKDMHDELGSVLTKINLLSEIAKRDKNDVEKLDTDLDKLSSASREVADTMDEIVWAVSPQNDNLENMLGYIAEKAEEFLSVTDIELQIKIPQEIPEYKIKAEIRHNLFMVIKESLNNIVKHSEAGKVEITANINSHGISIKIIDNGIGIDFNNIDKFSNGIKNMKNRIKEIGGVLIVENIKPNGVQVYINVKFKNHTFV